MKLTTMKPIKQYIMLRNYARDKNGDYTTLSAFTPQSDLELKEMHDLWLQLGRLDKIHPNFVIQFQMLVIYPMTQKAVVRNLTETEEIELQKILENKIDAEPQDAISQ